MSARVHSGELYGHPVDWGGDTAAPEFTWTYPCMPSSFVAILDSKNYDENPSAVITAPDPDAGGLTFSWSPSTPLQYPGHLYEYISQAWGGAGHMGGTYFWTGPFCTDTPPYEPILNSPWTGVLPSSKSNPRRGTMWGARDSSGSIRDGAGTEGEIA